VQIEVAGRREWHTRKGGNRREGKNIPRRNHVGVERKYMRGHEVELQGGAETTCLLECLVAKFEFTTQ